MPARTDSSEAARRRSLILEQERSGLKQAEFCRRNDISLNAFRIWKYRGHRDAARVAAAKAPRLVPVRLLGIADSTIDLVIAGGRTIRVRPGFDEETLTRLVAALENRAC
jgi:hypothetical protein